jgi:hypothetical protein
MALALAGIAMDNVFSQILARAVECRGSRSAVSELLRVPHATLERWMDGRSHMPLQHRQRLHALREMRERSLPRGDAGYAAPAVRRDRMPATRRADRPSPAAGTARAARNRAANRAKARAGCHERSNAIDHASDVAVS